MSGWWLSSGCKSVVEYWQLYPRGHGFNQETPIFLPHNIKHVFNEVNKQPLYLYSVEMYIAVSYVDMSS